MNSDERRELREGANPSAAGAETNRTSGKMKQNEAASAPSKPAAAAIQFLPTPPYGRFAVSG